jgi:hypothetical protein
MIAKVSQAVRAVHGQQTACKGVSQMAKKYILKIKDIHKKRAMQWAYHYDKREIVKQISPSLDVHRIITIIQNYIPAPELLVDGSLLNGRPHLAGIRQAETVLSWTYPQSELLCIWYWAADYWQNFVKAFQALPDPIYEDYWYAYDANIDALRFLPISQKAVDNSSIPVDNPVDKWGGTMGEKHEFPRNEAVSRRAW